MPNAPAAQRRPGSGSKGMAIVSRGCSGREDPKVAAALRAQVAALQKEVAKYDQLAHGIYSAELQLHGLDAQLFQLSAQKQQWTAEVDQLQAHIRDLSRQASHLTEEVERLHAWKAQLQAETNMRSHGNARTEFDEALDDLEHTLYGP